MQPQQISMKLVGCKSNYRIGLTDQTHRRKDLQHQAKSVDAV